MCETLAGTVRGQKDPVCDKYDIIHLWDSLRPGHDKAGMTTQQSLGPPAAAGSHHIAHHLERWEQHTDRSFLDQRPHLLIQILLLLFFAPALCLINASLTWEHFTKLIIL